MMISSAALVPVGLDLDGSLARQSQLVSLFREFVPLRQWENDLRLFANAKGLGVLRASLQNLPQRQPKLTFIGSGDFHHVTLALLEQLSTQYPLSLLLIDNHPDWFMENPAYHCGNWVSRALHLDHIVDATLVGQNSNDFGAHRWRVSPFHDLTRNRIRFYPFCRDSFRVFGCWPSESATSGQRRWWGTELCFRPILVDRPDGSWIDRVTASLAGRNVYVSIDKDALHPSYAKTDWDQGELLLEELVALLVAVRKNCHIVGADVCGEHAASPLRGIWKRMDAGRLLSHPHVNEHDLAVNEKCNLAILHALAPEVD